MSENKTDNMGSSTVTTISRIIELLSIHGKISPAYIARELDLARANVHRLLATLKEIGYVESHKDGSHSLTFRFFELANTVPYSRNLIDAVKPEMLKLASLTGETVSSAVLFQDEILFIDRVETSINLILGSQVGSSCPLHATSLGKAFLAFIPPAELEAILGRIKLEPWTTNTIVSKETLLQELDGVRQNGVAFCLQELSSDVNSIAAPVLDSRGQVCLAIGVSGPSDRFTLEKMKKIEWDLITTTRTVSHHLYGQPVRA